MVCHMKILAQEKEILIAHRYTVLIYMCFKGRQQYFSQKGTVIQIAQYLSKLRPCEAADRREYAALTNVKTYKIPS